MINPAIIYSDYLTAGRSVTVRKCITEASQECESAIEFGCMFGDKLQATRCNRKVGIDAYLPYLIKARALCHPNTEYLHADVVHYAIGLDSCSFDCVLMVDFIEHLSLDDALKTIDHAKRVAKKLVILMTPDGKHPQNKDETGMGGDRWQTHRSEWTPLDLESREFDTVVWKDFCTDERKDSGMLFAIWEK